MKKQFALLTSIILTATLGQAQTGGTGGGAGQSGGAGPGAGQSDGVGQSGSAGQSGGAGQGAGAQGTGQPGQSTGQAGGIGNPSPFQPRVNPSQPGVGGQEGTIFNQRTGANQPQPGQFGGTNQVRFGGTNQVLSGGTNRILFGGTNVQPGGTVNEAAGATSATNQAGQFRGSLTNQPGSTNQQDGNLGEQAFSQQMRGVLSRPGATQIFFPQTRSTVSVMNQNGALVLTGSVTSEEEKQSIKSRIQNTPGVISIDNQLQVGNGQNGVITPRTPGINPAPNSGINQGQGQDRRLLNP